MHESSNTAPVNWDGGSTWKHDLLASVVVFLVALPLCMGIAIASGVPAEKAAGVGIITGIVGGIVVGFLAGSPLLITGPAAGLSVLVYELVSKFGWEKIGLIVLLAGFIQLIAGLLKLGQWFRAVSPAVIHGMLAGIGVLIIASQFHIMLDDEPRESGLANIAALPEAVWRGVVPARQRRTTSRGPYRPPDDRDLHVLEEAGAEETQVVPAPLVAVIVATVVTVAAEPVHQASGAPGSLLDGIALPTIAGLDTWARGSRCLWQPLSIAFIASAETLLSAIGGGSDASRPAHEVRSRARCPGHRQHGVRFSRRLADDRRHRPQRGQRAGRRRLEQIGNPARRLAAGVRRGVPVRPAATFPRPAWPRSWFTPASSSSI